MLDKIADVVARYDEIERQMADPQVLADHVKLTELAQERAEMAHWFRSLSPLPED